MCSYTHLSELGGSERCDGGCGGGPEEGICVTGLGGRGVADSGAIEGGGGRGGGVRLWGADGCRGEAGKGGLGGGEMEL